MSLLFSLVKSLNKIALYHICLNWPCFNFLYYAGRNTCYALSSFHRHYPSAIGRNASSSDGFMIFLHRISPSQISVSSYDVGSSSLHGKFIVNGNNV